MVQTTVLAHLDRMAHSDHFAHLARLGHVDHYDHLAQFGPFGIDF